MPNEMMDQYCFGPESSFARDQMPAASHIANAPTPRSELIDIVLDWPNRVREVAARVTTAVHYRQPEFEKLWVVNQQQVDDFAAVFTHARSMDARLYRGTGHCIDFHHVGAAFQLEQLAFALHCATTD